LWLSTRRTFAAGNERGDRSDEDRWRVVVPFLYGYQTLWFWFGGTVEVRRAKKKKTKKIGRVGRV
jgi:hypothetical protein